MDAIGGAKILTERLLQGDEPVPAQVRAIEAADALPLFHWTGVEPAAPVEPPPAPRPRRRRRFR